MTTTTRLLFLLLLLIALPMAGALGLVLIEGWSFFDALYMAVITLTTVGYEEVRPLSTAGRMLIIAYLVVGLGAFLYSVTHIGELLLRGELRQRLGWRLMNATLRSLKDHHIICGCGQTGAKLGALLAERGERFVIVDRDPGALKAARTGGWPALVGDATDDATLRSLRIGRAKGLAAILSSDADNLFVVLSARLLNPGLNILARATHEASIGKLERAGADRVVNLHHIGATKMAHLLANPELVDVTELGGAGDAGMDLVQVAVSSDSPHCNRTLADAGLRANGVTVVGIRRQDGELLLLPSDATPVLAGDTLTALGSTEALGTVTGATQVGRSALREPRLHG